MWTSRRWDVGCSSTCSTGIPSPSGWCVPLVCVAWKHREEVKRWSWKFTLHCLKYIAPLDAGGSKCSLPCPSVHYDQCRLLHSRAHAGVIPGRLLLIPYMSDTAAKKSLCFLAFTDLPKVPSHAKRQALTVRKISNIRCILKMNWPCTLYKASGHDPEQIRQSDITAHPS